MYCESPATLLTSLAELAVTLPNEGDVDVSLNRSLVHHTAVHPESRQEKLLQAEYQSEGPKISPQLLRYYYAVLGGDLSAVERRHYGVVAMTLDTVLEERNSEQ